MPTGVDGFLAQQARLPARDVARRLRMGDVADAEDIRQDVAVEWLEKRSELPAGGQEGSWWRTLKNRKLRLDRARRREEARKPRIEAHVRLAQPPEPSPESQLERARVKAWCVAQVDAGRREVAERNVLGDETLDEIAEERGKPVGTVRSQWARGKEDMRAAVERLPEKERRALRLALLLLAVLSAVWVRLVRRARGRPRPLVACAACASAIAVAGHGAHTAPVAVVVAAADLSALEDEDARPLDRVAATVVPYLPAWAEREASEARPASARGSAVRPGSAAGAGSAARPGSAAGAGSAVQPSRAAPGPVARRALLSRAQEAMDAGDRKAARAARLLYEATYAHDAYPAQHADIVSDTAAP